MSRSLRPAIASTASGSWLVTICQRDDELLPPHDAARPAQKTTATHLPHCLGVCLIRDPTAAIVSGSGSGVRAPSPAGRCLSQGLPPPNPPPRRTAGEGTGFSAPGAGDRSAGSSAALA